jgi:rhamnogalacturonyl hydrolase YesR
MGRRHARQQWTALLSAHVWVPGWIASYYLSGSHRGLDVAKMTGDYYLRRIFGDHGLTGRRLYLSVWNLTELWDATKDPAYAEELHDRVDRMLQLQREQGGSLTMDRYGYSQPYVARGLTKYLQMTGDEDVRRALTRHARWVRDNPPLNHEMESYLATISTLMAGYRVSDEPSFFQEAVRRAQVLKMDPLEDPVSATSTQKSLAEAIEAASRLPKGRDGRPAIWRSIGGLRVFGWTHMYHLPWLMQAINENGEPAVEKSPLPPGY